MKATFRSTIDATAQSTAPPWLAVGTRERLTLEVEFIVEGPDAGTAEPRAAFLPLFGAREGGGEADTARIEEPIIRKPTTTSVRAELAAVPFSTARSGPRWLAIWHNDRVIARILLLPKWLVRALAVAAVMAAVYALLRTGWILTSLADTSVKRWVLRGGGLLTTTPALVSLLRIVRDSFRPGSYPFASLIGHPVGMALYAVAMVLVGTALPTQATVVVNASPTAIQFKNGGGRLEKATAATVLFESVDADWVAREIQDEKKAFCARPFDVYTGEWAAAGPGACALRGDAVDHRWPILPLDPAPKAVGFSCVRTVWRSELLHSEALGRIEGFETTSEDPAMLVTSLQKDSCAPVESAKVSVDVGPLAAPALPAQRMTARILPRGALQHGGTLAAFRNVFGSSFRLEGHEVPSAAPFVTFAWKPALANREVEEVRLDADLRSTQDPARVYPNVLGPTRFTVSLEGEEIGTLEATPSPNVHLVWHGRANRIVVVDVAKGEQLSTWKESSVRAQKPNPFVAIDRPSSPFDLAIDAVGKLRLPRQLVPRRVHHVESEKYADCTAGAEGVEVDVHDRMQPTCIALPIQIARRARCGCLRGVWPPKKCDPGATSVAISESKLDGGHKAILEAVGCDPTDMRWQE